MPPITPTQRNAITQFTSVTGANERTAAKILKIHAWKIDASVDAFYSQSGLAAPAAKNNTALIKMFDEYHSAEDEKDCIGVNSCMTYLGDLNVDLESAAFLIPMEIMQAPQMGQVTKDGFLNGWKTVGADTLEKQQQYVAKQTSLLTTDPVFFKKVYRFTFGCAKDPAQKALALSDALVYWNMLFSSPGYSISSENTNWLEEWASYLSAKWKKSVNKDMWNQTFEFFLKAKSDDSLSFWTEDSAWPGVIDDFVLWMKEKRGEGESEKMETD